MWKHSCKKKINTTENLKKKKKIINGNAQQKSERKINLLSWRHRRWSQRECHFCLIFHFSLQWHTHRVSLLFIWEYCSALHTFFFFSYWFFFFLRMFATLLEFSHIHKIFPNFSFLFSFRLIVPSKKYFMRPFAIIYNLFYFVVRFFLVGMMWSRSFEPLLLLFDSWVDLISCVSFFSMVSATLY